jgi:hypothetical protein
LERVENSKMPAWNLWGGWHFSTVPALNEIHVLAALSWHPCLDPQSAACVQPAPKSRFVASERSRYEDQRQKHEHQQKYQADAVPVGAWLVPQSGAQRQRNQTTRLCLTLRMRRSCCRSKHQADAFLVGARLPAICRAAVAKSGNSVMSDTPHAPALLPVPGRSSGCGPETSHAPTVEGGVRTLNGPDCPHTLRGNVPP